MDGFMLCSFTLSVRSTKLVQSSLTCVKNCLKNGVTILITNQTHTHQIYAQSWQERDSRWVTQVCNNLNPVCCYQHKNGCQQNASFHYIKYVFELHFQTYHLDVKFWIKAGSSNRGIHDAVGRNVVHINLRSSFCRTWRIDWLLW